MANICWNTLTITGDSQEINKLKTKLRTNADTPISFNTTVPMPDELQNTEAPNRDKIQSADLLLKYGIDNWYDWSLRNWGTKWDAYDLNPSDPDEKIYKNGKTKIVYGFSTAWAPPIEWVEKTSELYPTLEFKIRADEPGMNIYGFSTFINGKLIKDQWRP